MGKREKYTDADMLQMTKHLYRCCKSLVVGERKMAETPGGLQIWQLLEDTQHTTHTASSMTTRYTRFLRHKEHTIAGVDQEMALFLLQRYKAKFARRDEKRLLLGQCSSYKITFDQKDMIDDYHRSDSGRSPVSVTTPQRLARDENSQKDEGDDEEEEEEEEEMEIDDLESSTDDDSMTLSPRSVLARDRKRAANPLDTSTEQLVRHAVLILANYPDEPVTYTPSRRRVGPPPKPGAPIQTWSEEDDEMMGDAAAAPAAPAAAAARRQRRRPIVQISSEEDEDPMSDAAAAAAAATAAKQKKKQRDAFSASPALRSMPSRTTRPASAAAAARSPPAAAAAARSKEYLRRGGASASNSSFAVADPPSPAARSPLAAAAAAAENRSTRRKITFNKQCRVRPIPLVVANEKEDGEKENAAAAAAAASAAEAEEVEQPREQVYDVMMQAEAMNDNESMGEEYMEDLMLNDDESKKKDGEERDKEERSGGVNKDRFKLPRRKCTPAEMLEVIGGGGGEERKKGTEKKKEKKKKREGRDTAARVGAVMESMCLGEQLALLLRSHFLEAKTLAEMRMRPHLVDKDAIKRDLLNRLLEDATSILDDDDVFA